MGAVVGILLESLISIFKKGKPHSAMDCLVRCTRGKSAPLTYIVSNTMNIAIHYTQSIAHSLSPSLISPL